MHRRGVSPAGLLLPIFSFSFESRTPGLSCMCMSGLGVCEGQRGGSVRGRGPSSGGLSGSGAFEGGTRRGERAVGVGVAGRRAYGVAVTFLPHKGGAVPESERRRAAWRITEPSHTCLCFLLCCPISSSLSHLGGAGVGGAAGAGARCGAVRAIVCLASCRVCLRLFLLTTKSS